MERGTAVPLRGKVALVTGAASGIGRAIAIELAQQGASVVVNYHSDKDPGQPVVDEIIGAGGSALPLQADVSKAEDVNRMIQQELPDGAASYELQGDDHHELTPVDTGNVLIGRCCCCCWCMVLLLECMYWYPASSAAAAAWVRPRGLVPFDEGAHIPLDPVAVVVDDELAVDMRRDVVPGRDDPAVLALRGVPGRRDVRLRPADDDHRLADRRRLPLPVVPGDVAHQPAVIARVGRGARRLVDQWQERRQQAVLGRGDQVGGIEMGEELADVGVGRSEVIGHVHPIRMPRRLASPAAAPRRPLRWPSGRSGGTGRRGGLKLRCPQGRQGSNPCSGTTTSPGSWPRSDRARRPGSAAAECEAARLLLGRRLRHRRRRRRRTPTARAPAGVRPGRTSGRRARPDGRRSRP